MTWPASIITRTVSVGPGVVMETGGSMSVRARVKASRSLVWDETGTSIQSVESTFTSEDGFDVSFALPVTDQAGWLLNGNVVDVSDGNQSHYYTITADFMVGTTVTSTAKIGPFALPQDDLSEVDADLLIPAPSMGGVTISIPDQWSNLVAAAQAAAAAAEAAMIDSDAFIASRVNDPASATNAALEAYSKKSADAAQSFIALVKAQIVDPCILVVGDSTSIDGRWPHTGDGSNPGLAERLATLFPTHSVLFYQFDQTGATFTYNAPITVSTGSGPRTIRVYNASIGGHNCNAWKGAKGDGAFNVPATATAGMLPAPSATSTGGPDLTFVSLGHNEGVNDYWWHGQYLGLTEDLTRRHVGALVVVSQNPTMSDNTTGATSDGLQEARREVYRRIAARRGYGFIDATQAWFDSGHAGDWTSDGTHPITVGSSFWADVVARMFAWDRNGMPRTQPPSLFSLAGPNLLRNGDFQDGDDYWALTGVTSAVDTTHFETSSNTAGAPTAFTSTARKFTADGSGNNFFSQRIPVERVRGKWVTIAVRQWVDSTVVDAPGAGVVQIQDSVSTLGTTQNVGATNGKNGWRWDVFSKFIDPAATYVIVKVFTNSGVNAGANITADRVWAGEGRWPSDVRRRENPNTGVWTAWTPALSSNITLGSGTIVGTYRQDTVDKTVDVFARITLAADSVVNGSVATTVALPVNVLASPSAVIAANARLIDSGTPYLGMAYDAGTHDKLTVRYLGTNGVGTNLTGTAPFTFGTGDIIEVSARYRYA